jgi:glyoxylase-like metal-dependent hydrolase (beta-lactamase superfamily II)
MLPKVSPLNHNAPIVPPRPQSAMTSVLPWVQNLPHGIDVIDTGFQRPQFDASYLIAEAGRAAFIDTGTNDSVPRLLAALAARGLSVEAVDWVIATHVHLDHAGGVGELMRHLPCAKLVAHPRGAPHLIDPRKLVQGAQAVYGAQAVALTYGTVVGVPSERVTSTTEGMTLMLADRPLRFLDTPGHARHHHCIWDERSQGVFTGDTFGLSYRELDTPKGAYVLPSSTPVQFDPGAMKQSVERLLALKPHWAYLTHFGRVGEVPRLGKQLLSQIDAMVACAHAVAAQILQGSARQSALCESLAQLYETELRSMGSTRSTQEIRECLAVDIELNAQGLAVWLDTAPHPPSAAMTSGGA